MNYLKLIWISIGCLIATSTVFAQNRTGYFNKNLYIGNRLNPANLPDRGYLVMPILGNLQAGMASDLKMKDLIYALSTDESILNDNSFYDKMKLDNRMRFDINMDILSFGWWRGANFWSVNVGLKTNFSASLPKSLFEHMRTVGLYDYGFGDETLTSQNIDIRNLAMDMKAYSDIGVGYSRQINEKISVGGRAKLLLGFMHFDLAVDELHVEMNLPDNPDNPDNWQEGSGYGGYSSAQAHIKTAFGGGGLSFDQHQVVDGFDFDRFAIAGLGVGVDLGITYSPIERLNVSASVLDLGFLKWKKDATSMAAIDNEESVEITHENYDRYLDSDVFGLGMYEMRKVETEGYKTGLGTTLMLGGEYLLGAQKQFSVGALYSARFVEPSTISAFSVIGSYAPSTAYFNASLSYSYIQETGNVLGLILKTGRSFIGADYAFAGPQKSFNVYIGAAFPLGKTRDQ